MTEKIEMKKLAMLTLSSFALILGTPAAAQNNDASKAEQQETPISTARLTAAKTTVDYLFPLGTYERMMKGTMDQLLDSMIGSVMGSMTIGDMAGASGIPDEGLTEEEKAQSIGDIAREADPHFDERTKISTRVMMDEMVGIMTKMEPALREALTKIYARKYSVKQLGEMNAFFATDTGSAFARDYMMVFVDPEMMQSMMGMVPEIMSAMPDIMKKVEEATAHLPPPPKPSADESSIEVADEEQNEI